MSIFRKKEIQMEDVKGLWGKFNDLRKMIDKIEGYCTFKRIPMPKAGHSYGVGYMETVGINVKVKEIEKKLDLLITHLELEEYKPDCTVKLRKVKKG